MQETSHSQDKPLFPCEIPGVEESGRNTSPRRKKSIFPLRNPCCPPSFSLLHPLKKHSINYRDISVQSPWPHKRSLAQTRQLLNPPSNLGLLLSLFTDFNLMLCPVHLSLCLFPLTWERVNALRSHLCSERVQILPRSLPLIRGECEHSPSLIMQSSFLHLGKFSTRHQLWVSVGTKSNTESFLHSFPHLCTCFPIFALVFPSLHLFFHLCTNFPIFALVFPSLPSFSHPIRLLFAHQAQLLSPTRGILSPPT